MKNLRDKIGAGTRRLGRRFEPWLQLRYDHVAHLQPRLELLINSSTSHARRTRICAILSGIAATLGPC